MFCPCFEKYFFEKYFLEGKRLTFYNLLMLWKDQKGQMIFFILKAK